ncbi:hypothetical protein [Goodfellowiella coeruleoviolacea]|uniref:Uncharacterized protein n=1 Tax=Goodfellowiella coeruleoviolacea TaxID=334858 RepID=A0AAE3GA73_9PSEU|nr:hypothetical protein [Goodfellowiella coeruleoviolacea]MCP2163244.1 hypothetical protein [Goodfellowiella coeruleoviolacea]
MTSDRHSRRGYRLEPDELSARIAELTALADETAELVSSASRLAERLPMLGTAPPALHLAEQLREAAGRSGLTGEVDAATAELDSFRQALTATLLAYQDGESDIRWTLRAAGEALT